MDTNNETVTNPDESEVPVEIEEVEVESPDNVESDGEEQPDYDEEGEAVAQVDEVEDLEFNGQKFKAPKDLASAVKTMKYEMDKDYTTKTTALAESRKKFEAEAQFQYQMQQENAKMISFDDQIAQYKNLDWARLNNEDPVMFQNLRLQYDNLKEAKQELGQQLALKQQQLALYNQQETAKKVQESEAVLRREIKDWSPKLENDLQDYAVKEYGFDLDDVKQSKADPRLYKLLYKSYIGDQILKKQTAKPANVAKKAEPVPVVAGRTSKVHKNPAEQSWAEYDKWRKSGRK